LRDVREKTMIVDAQVHLWIMGRAILARLGWN
jgi:hypothetical protein